MSVDNTDDIMCNVRKNKMTGEERRKNIVSLLSESNKPLSGDAIAAKMGVSRQVIVQDMALIRTKGISIYSTNRGYVIEKNDSQSACRVFKVIHSDEETADEMNLIVDLGGHLIDVFVYHKVYGVMRGELNVKSRLDVVKYMEKIKSGKSSLLKNVTGGYHYHTVIAENEEILDYIQNELAKKGYLAKLSEYEPVEFG